MKKNKYILFLICFYIFGLSAQTESNSDAVTFEEKENEVINYDNIKKVLQNDGLDSSASEKKSYVKQVKQERKKINKEKYNFPSKNDFWKLMSELWLVKNAQLLRWDFPRPEYGIDKAFKQLLERYGYYNYAFKILVVNTPQITHFALPAGEKESIFILSLPFMRSLDLTKVDLSLLLLEDFLRLKEEFFQDEVDFDKSLLGTNFYEKKMDKKVILKVLESYSELVFKKGFTFQQQYKITKKMDSLLKSEPQLWGAYFRLYKKIDQFIKSDMLYKNYLKVYPSPELQIQWLSPKKKVI